MRVTSRAVGVLALAAGLLLLVPGLAAAGIAGSVHDFSGSPFSGGQICVVCHAPHNNQNAVGELLWNHDLTSAIYTLYASPTLDAAAPTQPLPGSSRLCLSCHDGTVAVDSFGGATGTQFITGPANFGTDFSDDHPIAILYDTTLATTDGGLADPATTTQTIGGGAFTRTGTIDAVMLEGGLVQCRSCHSVHNDFVVGGIGGSPLLKVSKLSSALCLTCHTK